jgi:glycosyltransferase involved in cell wall biosynthesis
MVSIGHVTTHFLPVIGGQEVYVRSLIDALPDLEHQVFQLSASGVTQASGVTVRMFRRYRRLPQYASMVIGLTLSRAALAHCDALIVNYPEYYRPVAWHRAVIVLSHGATWGNLSGRKRSIKVSMSRQAIEGCAAYVFNDTFAMREINIPAVAGARMFEWITPKAFFLPNCVDVNRFAPATPLRRLKEMNCICVPRNLNHGRGIDLAIQALSLLLGRGFDVCLIVVGDSNIGDHEYRKQLFELITEREMEGRVLFLGSLENRRMPMIYSSCVATLIPTRYREGTSLAALESMACGTPVVATNVEGLLDLPALHCDPSAESIANAIVEAIKKREILSREQRERVRRDFNIERWSAAWAGILQTVTAAHPSRGKR